MLHSINSILGQVRDAQLSPQEILDRQKKQLITLNALDAQFHCIVDFIDPSPAKSGPLHGLGFIHKDIFNLSNHEPGFGLHVGLDRPGIANARVIQKLEDAGATQLASAVMPAFACGASSQNNNFPRCINPLNPSYVVGGSSSGSAVAVAAGMTPISLGTDTTGSVRIPAASCGIFGLKTTKGIISTEGVKPLSPTLDNVGILGHDCEDLRLILDIVSEVNLVNPPTPSKVGLWLPNCVDQPLSQDIQHFIQRQLGDVSRVDITEFEMLRENTDHLMAYEANQFYGHLLHSSSTTKSLKAVCRSGQNFTDSDYQAMLVQQAFMTKAFLENYLTSLDIIILPCFTCSLPNWDAVEIGHEHFDKNQLIGLFHLMGFVNYLGLPALAIPIGFDSEGRPLSVQAIGQPHSEHRLLNFAKQLLQR